MKSENPKLVLVYKHDLKHLERRLEDAKWLITNLLREAYDNNPNADVYWKIKAKQFLKEEGPK